MKTTFEIEELKNIPLCKGSTAYIKSSQAGWPVILGVEVDYISYKLGNKRVEVHFINHHFRTQDIGIFNKDIFLTAEDAIRLAIYEYELTVSELKSKWEEAEAHLAKLKKDYTDKNYSVK